MPDTTATRLRELEYRVAQLEHLLHGGGTVRWEDSVRGRMHRLLNAEASAHAMAEAARELRRAQHAGWSRREKVIALVVAIVGAAAPYVVLFLHH